MKVLFVCYANMGRSQVAQVCFSQLSSHESYSAGMGVDEAIRRRNLPVRKVKDSPNSLAAEFIKAEFGVDLSERERNQLTPQMIEEADMAIIINRKEDWPDYLVEGGKVVFWDIPDTPGVADTAAHEIWKRVRQRVEELVREIG